MPDGLSGHLVNTLSARDDPQDAPAFDPDLHCAIAAAEVGLWRIDAASGRQYWDPRTRSIYALPPEAAAPDRQQWRATFLHPDDAERAARRAQEFESTRRPYELEYRIRRGDGEVRWLYSRAVFNPEHSGEVLGLTLDITERKSAEAELAAARERLARCTEASGIGTWDRDLVTGEGRWNDTLFAICRRPPAEGVPSWRELRAMYASDADRAVAEAALARMHREPGTVVQFEASVRRGDGSIAHMLLCGHAEHAADGRPLRLAGNLIDISERRAAEALVRQRTLDRLAEQMRLELTSKFVSRMSHEMRTPLNAVLGFAQLMALDRVHPLSPEQQARVQTIQTSAWQLLAMIDDLLRMDRAGPVPPAP
jgi:PAS domain-containing protein